MDKFSSSPERPPVKVTYLDRQKEKRKRKITETTECVALHLSIDHAEVLMSDPSDPSHSNIATTDSAASAPPTTPSGKGKKMIKVATMKAPESKGPPKIDVHLPGPALKRFRRDSDESVKSTVSAQPKKSLHARTTSSISLSRTPQKLTSTTAPISTTNKLPSVAGAKPTSLRRHVSPDTDVDDSVSLADSTISIGRVRRSEAQRLEYFKNEPLCGALTKESAECKRCGKSIRLGSRTTYSIRPWEMHRARCDQKPVVDEGEDQDMKKSKQQIKTKDQRIAILNADPAVSSLKPHEVLCRNCGTWIRLSTHVPYKLTNWRTHSLVCQTPTKHQPSDRVAAATRKLQLVNDSQAESYTEHAVVCAFCKTTITSNREGEYQGDYNLLAWIKHKATCTRPRSISPQLKNAPSAVASEVSSVPFPRPPHSTASASTEATLVASDLKQTAHIQSTKRPREDEESFDRAPDISDARPANRPRTENHEMPVEQSTSAASWLSLPFQAFMRGFKESLKH